MNGPETKEFIKQIGHLFWWVPEAQKENLSVESLVEQILNYGNEQEVKRLFELIGLEKVGKIFYRHTSGGRCNYFPQVINFFTLYFQRHVSKNPHQRTN